MSMGVARGGVAVGRARKGVRAGMDVCRIISAGWQPVWAHAACCLARSRDVDGVRSGVF